MSATPTNEPAAYAEAARLVILAVVGLGWITVDNTTANIIASTVGGVLSIVFTLLVRSHVSPVNADSPAGNPGGAVSDVSGE